MNRTLLLSQRFTFFGITDLERTWAFLFLSLDFFKPFKREIKGLCCSLLKSKVIFKCETFLLTFNVWFNAGNIQGLCCKSIWAISSKCDRRKLMHTIFSHRIRMNIKDRNQFIHTFDVVYTCDLFGLGITTWIENPFIWLFRWLHPKQQCILNHLCISSPQEFVLEIGKH